MTDLTDKWKKGELPNGWYYVKVITEFEYPDDIAFYTGEYFELYSDEEIEQVLTPLPSYEEYLSLTYAKEEDEGIIAEYEAENTNLKELLKECELWFTGVVGNMNDKNVGEHNRNLPIGNFEYAFNVFSQKINKALGKDK